MKYERIKLTKEEVLKNLKQSNNLSQLTEMCGCGRNKIRAFVKDNGIYKEYCEQLNIKYVEPIIRQCEICGNTKTINSLNGHYYCKKHYNQIYRKGHIYETIYDRNEYRFEDNFCYIIIKNRFQEKIDECIIDKKYYNKVKDLKWYKSNGYCVTKGINKDSGIDIANVIYDDFESMYDHINNNKLNNRDINLRIVNSQQNAMNMGKKNTNISGVTGVSKQKQTINKQRIETGRWYANITYNYKSIWLGVFDTFNEAVESRILGEIKYFKEFSPNFKPSTNTIRLDFISKDNNKKYIYEYDLKGNKIRKEIL